MKSLLNVLRVLISIILIGIILLLGEYLYDIISFPFSEKELDMALAIKICKASLLVYFGIYLNKFLKVMSTSLSQGTMFSDKNGRSLYAIGMAFVYYSVLYFLVSFIEDYYNSIRLEESSGYIVGYALGKQIAAQIPLLLFAVFLLIISKLMIDGYQLKKENELTI